MVDKNCSTSPGDDPLATRRTVPPPQAPALTADQMRRRIDRLQKCIDELGAFDPQKVQRRYREPEVCAWKL
jgi:hypothetical protein